MPNPFPSARHQAAINVPTGTRRFFRFTFSRGGVVAELEPTGGSLTQDARRNARWDGRLQFSGDDVMPDRPGDLLTPFGTRVQAEIGLELLDGSVSTVPYGTYEIASAKATEAPDAQTVDVALVDPSARVERYRFETPVTIAAGTDLATMINTVVTNRTGRTLGAARTFGLDVGTYPWSELLDVLDAFSLTAWYDRTGQIMLGNLVPDPATAYPLDTLTTRDTNYDTQPPNVIVARGESTDGSTPVQAVAIDSDPSSPTYAGTGPGTSPYGRKTEFYSSPLIKTLAQAQSAAATILAQNIGAGATYQLLRPFDPTVTAADVISFGGVPHAVDAVTLNLDGNTSMWVRELS